MDDTSELWGDVNPLAGRVADTYRGTGVSRIEATSYTDSLGRDAVHFRVWLRDKPDQSDYEWPELSPIERALSEGLQQVEPDWIPYADYALESEAAQKTAEAAR